MTDPTQTRSAAMQRPFSQNLYDLARYYLGGRRGLLVLAALALLGGAVFNWGWLVAIGVAPLLLAVLPCVAMCALGLCMRGTAGNSCDSKAAATPTSGAAEAPVRLTAVEQVSATATAMAEVLPHPTGTAESSPSTDQRN